MGDEIKTLKISARLLWFLMGFLSIGAQTILMRAGIVTFSGNEMIVGAMLFAWTVWIGVGSLIAGRMRAAADVGKMYLCLTSALALLPATYFAVYCGKIIIRIPTALTASPFVSFVFFAIALAPLCACLGACFSIGCGLAAEQAGKAVARTYLWEALGAGAGGITVGGAILPMFSGANGIFIIDVLSATALLFDSVRRSRKSYSYCAIWLIVVVCSIAAVALNAADFVKQTAWRGYSIVAERDSKYSHLMMTKQESQFTLFVNGAPTESWPGSPTDETLAHLAITLNHEARHALLIGGGATVGAKLLDGKNIESVDYCEIDPAAIEMEKQMPSPFWRDKRVNLRIEDGRSRVQNSSRVYELIVLNVGEPTTLSQNRYFTKEFFALAKRALKENGVLIFGAGEYANYVGEDQALFLKTVINTLLNNFTNIGVFPIDNFYISASEKSPIPNNADGLVESYNKTGLNGKYFYADKIKYDLSPDRFDAINKMLNNKDVIYINNDFHPLGYALQTNIWLSLFNEDIFSKSIKVLFAPTTPLIFIILILIAVTAVARTTDIDKAYAILIFIAGFAGMAIEIIVLYIIQIKIGALFGYLSLVISIYMIGLSVGGRISNIHIKHSRNIRIAYIINIIISVLLVIINTFANADKILLLIILSIVTLLCSISCGYIFGATAALASEREKDAGRIGGKLNFADLVGGAFAAVLFPLLAIPAWGLNAALFILLAALSPILAIKSKIKS